ncbi:hypothetical protein B0I37DRAFT_394041 [Chaetomium sp. MPI-CAGE-AT-0009]|nr:hypothetical protein B0I37DRAFT_394041 [Chaetomium sp. MPI-CAGE-AT-0009]
MSSCAQRGVTWGWNGRKVNGTLQPPSGKDLATLNPCLLNVWCNTWRQCGTTDDFCAMESETGAQGTAAPGKRGCIRNCGRDIVKGSPLSKKVKIAYYEFWELEQFELIRVMKAIKKIISFGGWGFSTKSGTYSIFAEAALLFNLEILNNSLIVLMNEHGWDDWLEDSQAPDIPDIPCDVLLNGINYDLLLLTLRKSVRKYKSLHNDDYDNKFRVYESYVKAQIP